MKPSNSLFLLQRPLKSNFRIWRTLASELGLFCGASVGISGIIFCKMNVLRDFREICHKSRFKPCLISLSVHCSSWISQFLLVNFVSWSFRPVCCISGYLSLSCSGVWCEDAVFYDEVIMTCSWEQRGWHCCVRQTSNVQTGNGHIEKWKRFSTVVSGSKSFCLESSLSQLIRIHLILASDVTSCYYPSRKRFSMVPKGSDFRIISCILYRLKSAFYLYLHKCLCVWCSEVL